MLEPHYSWILLRICLLDEIYFVTLQINTWSTIMVICRHVLSGENSESLNAQVPN